MKMNSVIHFEMPAADRKRVAKFYSKVFNWKMELMGKDFGKYIVAMTTESTKKGPKKPGAINGGFYMKSDVPKAAQLPSVVIAVEDLTKHIQKVKKAKGKVLGKPIDIPRVGKYVAFKDSEGNRVGMLEPARS